MPHPSVFYVDEEKIRLLFDVKPAVDEPLTLYLFNRYAACKAVLVRTGDMMEIQKIELR